MKRISISLIGLMFMFSCGGEEETEVTSDASDVVLEENDSTEIIDEVVEELPAGVFQTNGTVLSVREELIMPSDYLTTALTVETDNRETFVFLNMSEYADLEGKRVSIQYKLTESERLLVCFDCYNYTEPVELHDITSIASEVSYESMKLSRYIEDEYVIPASIFEMSDAAGNITKYRSNDNSMIADSVKMSSDYFNYGYVVTFYPELIKIEEQ
jgi:hypothetical protein